MCPPGPCGTIPVSLSRSHSVRKRILKERKDSQFLLLAVRLRLSYRVAVYAPRGHCGITLRSLLRSCSVPYWIIGKRDSSLFVALVTRLWLAAERRPVAPPGASRSIVKDPRNADDLYVKG
jgi:hypothetical protein